jgi:hypothetical protein
VFSAPPGFHTRWHGYIPGVALESHENNHWAPALTYLMAQGRYNPVALDEVRSEPAALAAELDSAYATTLLTTMSQRLTGESMSLREIALVMQEVADQRGDAAAMDVAELLATRLLRYLDDQHQQRQQTTMRPDGR